MRVVKIFLFGLPLDFLAIKTSQRPEKCCFNFVESFSNSGCDRRFGVGGLWLERKKLP